METKNINKNISFGNISGIITIVLIIAKVWGSAEISWLFCFMPIIICFCITFVAIVIMVVTNVMLESD